MPWRTLCGFEPTTSKVTLRVPNAAWRPDTVITDEDGTEMFVLLDKVDDMRSYEAIFGDLEGHRLVCVRRHLIKAFWKDGFYFCTYKPNYKDQKPLAERDIDNKKIYPFSYMQISPMKGRFFYRIFQNPDFHDSVLSRPKMIAQNPWLGFMVVCCTPMIRGGKWTCDFKKTRSRTSNVFVDQWRNVVEVQPGNDLLAALCMAYVFDKMQCQPLVTVFGEDEEEFDDNLSIDSREYGMDGEVSVQMDGVPPGTKVSKAQQDEFHRQAMEQGMKQQADQEAAYNAEHDGDPAQQQQQQQNGQKQRQRDKNDDDDDNDDDDKVPHVGDEEDPGPVPQPMPEPTPPPKQRTGLFGRKNKKADSSANTGDEYGPSQPPPEIV